MFLNILLADALTVSSTPIGSNNSNEIIMNSINSSFSPNLQINTTASLEIPIYLRSDVLKEIKMKISNFSNLKKNTDNIETRLYYRTVNNAYVQIFNSQEFVLLPANQLGRDGSTIIGYIKIELNIPNIQAFGHYSLNSTIDAKISDGSFASNSFNITADIALVAVAGFNSTSSYNIGEKFIDDHVNFGNLNFTSNIIEKELYIKSNSNHNFRITFRSTPNLIHELDTHQIIHMNYYYKQLNNSYFKINAASSFIASTGQNNGISPVGSIKFETENITAEKLAGDYSTSILLTISAE
jgi:hypothetical protein